jgi:hypothetical protein
VILTAGGERTARQDDTTRKRPLHAADRTSINPRCRRGRQIKNALSL